MSMHHRETPPSLVPSRLSQTQPRPHAYTLGGRSEIFESRGENNARVKIALFNTGLQFPPPHCHPGRRRGGNRRKRSHHCLAHLVTEVTFGKTKVALVSGKEPICQCRRCQIHGFDPWVGNIPWRRKWKPTPVFLPGESHGQRSLGGYSPRGHKELDTT